MITPPVQIHREGALARLMLANVEKQNPIEGEFCAAWADACNALSVDTGVRAVLLQSDARNFSVGGDIGTFVENLDTLPGLIRQWTIGFHAGVMRLRRANAPVVAAVNGVCAGGAVSLAASADYVVAGKDARFVSAYVGLGYCCDGGATIALRDRMGIARAKRFLMMRETLDAEQALAVGLVDEVVAPEQLEERATQVATGLAAGPTLAFGELKRLFVTASDAAFEAQLEAEALALARCAGTEDAREAIKAFAAKRAPEFKGE